MSMFLLNVWCHFQKNFYLKCEMDHTFSTLWLCTNIVFQLMESQVHQFTCFVFKCSQHFNHLKMVDVVEISIALDMVEAPIDLNTIPINWRCQDALLPLSLPSFRGDALWLSLCPTAPLLPPWQRKAWEAWPSLQPRSCRVVNL